MPFGSEFLEKTTLEFINEELQGQSGCKSQSIGKSI